MRFFQNNILLESKIGTRSVGGIGDVPPPCPAPSTSEVSDALVELAVGSVPSQVLRVETRLENPTLYHVMESQKRQVRRFLQQNPCHYPDGLQPPQLPQETQRTHGSQKLQEREGYQESSQQIGRQTTSSLPSIHFGMRQPRSPQPEDRSVTDVPAGAQHQQASAPAGTAATPQGVRDTRWSTNVLFFVR